MERPTVLSTPTPAFRPSLPWNSFLSKSAFCHLSTRCFSIPICAMRSARSAMVSESSLVREPQARMASFTALSRRGIAPPSPTSSVSPLRSSATGANTSFKLPRSSSRSLSCPCTPRSANERTALAMLSDSPRIASPSGTFCPKPTPYCRRMRLYQALSDSSAAISVSRPCKWSHTASL